MIGFLLGNQAGVKLSALAANRAIESIEDSKNPVSQQMNSGIPEYLLFLSTMLDSAFFTYIRFVDPPQYPKPRMYRDTFCWTKCF
jgi:hypothetical protein